MFQVTRSELESVAANCDLLVEKDPALDPFCSRTAWQLSYHDAFSPQRPVWFAQDGDPNGDGALSGVCTAVTPAYAPNPPWLDLDGTDDPQPGEHQSSGIQDTCGDIDADHNPLFPSVTLTVVCVDGDGNGQLDLPNCTSWRQPSA